MIFKRELKGDFPNKKKGKFKLETVLKQISIFENFVIGIFFPIIALFTC